MYISMQESFDIFESYKLQYEVEIFYQDQVTFADFLVSPTVVEISYKHKVARADFLVTPTVIIVELFGHS